MTVTDVAAPTAAKSKVEIRRLRPYAFLRSREAALHQFNSLLVQLSDTTKPLTMGDFIELLSNPNAHIYVLVLDGKFISTLTRYDMRTPGGMESLIKDVVTDVEFRGQGWADVLVRHAEQELPQASSHITLITNKGGAASKLFGKCGYSEWPTTVFRKILRISRT
jgi:ribosomal protein S18 acetylase RimI-like enzyme